MMREAAQQELSVELRAGIRVGTEGCYSP